MTMDGEPQTSPLRRAADRCRAMLPSRRLMGEASWVIGGQLGSAVVLLAGNRLLTELIQPGVFGTTNLCMSTVMLIHGFFCMPQIMAIQRYYPQMRLEGRVPELRATMFGSLVRGTLGLLTLLAITGLVAGAWIPDSLNLAVGSACYVLAETCRAYEQTYLMAARAQRVVAVWTVVDASLRIGGAATLVVLFGQRPEYVLCGYAAGIGLAYLGFGLFLRRTADAERAPAAPSSELSRELWRYSLPLMPNALIAAVHSSGDRWLLAWNSGTAAVGIYAVAYGLAQRPISMIGAFVGQTLRPLYYESAAAQDRRREAKVLRAWVGLMAMASLCGIVLITLFRHEITAILLAKEFRGAADLLPLLVIACSLRVVSEIFLTIGFAYRPQWVLASEVTAAVLMLVFGVILIPQFGAKGAAAAAIAAYAGEMIVSLLLSRLRHR